MMLGQSASLWPQELRYDEQVGGMGKGRFCGNKGE